jgi:hypothetical protein
MNQLMKTKVTLYLKIITINVKILNICNLPSKIPILFLKQSPINFKSTKFTLYYDFRMLINTNWLLNQINMSIHIQTNLSYEK